MNADHLIVEPTNMTTHDQPASKSEFRELIDKLEAMESRWDDDLSMEKLQAMRAEADALLDDVERLKSARASTQADLRRLADMYEAVADVVDGDDPDPTRFSEFAKSFALAYLATLAVGVIILFIVAQLLGKHILP